MKILLLSIFVFGISLNVFGGNNDKVFEKMQWSVYSKLPYSKEHKGQPGLAGTFSGLINNKLLIAGGANFSDSASFVDGKGKYWSDIYLLSLDDPDEFAVVPEGLPENMAFGVSITLPEGVLLVGGCNEEGCHDDVLMLKTKGGSSEIEMHRWPSLPFPLANMAGAVVGNKIYIAGGHQDMVNPLSGKHFFVIDTKNKDAGWKSLDPWPGPPRSFTVAAGQKSGSDNCFYLFGGINCKPDCPFEFCSDGYEYNPRLNMWKKIERLKNENFFIMGGGAFSSGANHIIFVGGAGDTLINKLMVLQSRQIKWSQDVPNNKDSINIVNSKVNHLVNHSSDFSKEVSLFHTITNTIIRKEVNFPASLTANVIKSGEKVFVSGRDQKPGEFIATIISGEFSRNNTGLGFWNIVIMVLYFAILLWMGWYFSKRTKNTNDYFRAGGKMSWFIVALSIYGTTLSSITYMAIPAKAYATDWSYLIYNYGLILCVPVIVLIFIPFYRKLDITSAYEYLERRFNVLIRVLASIAFVIFQVGRMAIVLYLPAIAINIITGFDIFLCILLMGIFSLIYTTMGGIEAVIWTDAVQVIVLFGGAVIALIMIALGTEGGITGIISTASADGKFHLADTSLNLKNPTLITALIATFFANLTTYGTDQTVVQRYMTTETQKKAVRSLWGKLIAALIGSLIFFFIGTALYVFYKDNPSALSYTITDGDAIFPWFVFTQMPDFFSSFILAGIFAAAMSTVSANINSAATSYSVDIHFRFGWTRKFKDLTVARAASLVLGVAGILLALLMATWGIVSFWDQFLSILGLFMGSFGGLFLLGLLTKRANGTGALIGIIASVLVQIWIDQNQAVHVLLYVATGSITCFVVGYFASFFLPQSKKDLTSLTIAKS